MEIQGGEGGGGQIFLDFFKWGKNMSIHMQTQLHYVLCMYLHVFIYRGFCYSIIEIGSASI